MSSTKTSGFLDTRRNNKAHALGTVGALISGGMLLSKMRNKLQNDMQRKDILEDLHLNDPILKQVDKASLIEWYATIMHFAPKFSLDKASVREVNVSELQAILKNNGAYIGI